MNIESNFQFHKGTIKALRAKILLFFAIVFQFHKGTIKAFTTKWSSAIASFQFHKGTIKAPCNGSSYV